MADRGKSSTSVIHHKMVLGLTGKRRRAKQTALIGKAASKKRAMAKGRHGQRGCGKHKIYQKVLRGTQEWW